MARPVGELHDKRVQGRPNLFDEESKAKTTALTVVSAKVVLLATQEAYQKKETASTGAITKWVVLVISVLTALKLLLEVLHNLHLI